MTSDQTGDEPAQTPAEAAAEKDRTNEAVEALSRGLGLDVADMLVRAVVSSFFNPVYEGYRMEPQQIAGPGGVMGTTMIAVPHHGPSPLSRLAGDLWSRHGEEILRKVRARIDLDEVAAEAATRVFNDLVKSENRNSWGRLTPAEHDIQTKVRDRLASMISQRELDERERMQREMRQAWLREQERAANAAPQLESSSGSDDSDGED